MVPLVGVEPTRYRYHGILSPARLPIPPQRRLFSSVRIPNVRNRIPACIIFAFIRKFCIPLDFSNGLCDNMFTDTTLMYHSIFCKINQRFKRLKRNFL